MTKYIFMFNFDKEEDAQIINDIKEYFPSVEYFNYGFRHIGDKPELIQLNNNVGLFVPEELFLAVHTFVNLHEGYKAYKEIDDDYGTIEDGIDYMNFHLAHKEYIKYL